MNVGYGEQGIEEHVRMIAQFRRWLAERKDQYVLVGTTDDIERARRERKLAVMR